MPNPLPYIVDDKPPGASNHVFWQWFDSLPQEARAWMNAAANGPDFKFRFEVTYLKYPADPLTGKARNVLMQAQTK